jgi:hypothetical protein
MLILPNQPTTANNLATNDRKSCLNGASGYQAVKVGAALNHVAHRWAAFRTR